MTHFTILDPAAHLEDSRPTSTRRWYDRNTQSWVVQTLDQYGTQMGDATYIGVRGGGKALAIEDEQYRQRRIDQFEAL